MKIEISRHDLKYHGKINKKIKKERKLTYEKKNFIYYYIITLPLLTLTSCKKINSDRGTSVDSQKQINNLGDKFAPNQPTPTDIDYSLERYNLIRRAYWVNGQREKQLIYLVKFKNHLVIFIH